MSEQPLNSGRPLWWVAGLSVVLLAVVGVVTWQLVRPDVYVANPPPVDPPEAHPDAAARTLQALEEAVETGDRDAAVALAGGDPAAEQLLGAVLDNAADLHVEDFTLRYVDEAGAVDAEGRWQAAVDMTWRFDGFDQVPVREEVLVGFDAEDGEAAAITGFGGGDRRSPVWLSGPLEVRRNATSLVLVAGADRSERADAAAAYARQAERAVPVVRRVLPAWPGGLVLEVPESAADLDAALAADPGTYANIAAVSASVDGLVTPESPVHVFVNPAVFGDLEPVGANVVIGHEATHVATDAPLTSGMPLWLLEGFADYVALRDVRLPITTTAAQIIEQVHRQGPPDALPGATEFDESSTHLGAAYESAWIACTLLADLEGAAAGEEALVELYERVQDGEDLDPTLEDLFGIDEAELTELWQDRLVELAELEPGTA